MGRAAAASSWPTRSTRFAIDVTGRLGLDIGASTGGFTDVLLQRGAAHVIALDVGHGQTALEAAQRRACHCHRRRQRASPHAERDLPQLGDGAGIVTIDVSFISLRHILPVMPALLAADADVVRSSSRSSRPDATTSARAGS